MLTNNVIVLGASGEIGSVITKYAALNDKCHILAVARSVVPAELAQIKNVHSLSGIDLRNQKDLLVLAQKAREVFDEPLSVIHAVGNFWGRKPLEKAPLEENCDVVESNVLTLLGAVTSLTPVMQEKGGGRFVAFSCNSVAYTYPYMASFTSSKAFIETFVKCFAHEKAEENISAFAVALPTIGTTKELLAKPNGDHANFIPPEVLADFICSRVLTLPHEATGNVLTLYRHSPDFYRTGYLECNAVTL
jgi:NAD(P)-dependent dehydrogenase (short-subunit alcohol dehydrogenase family)